LRYHGIRSQRDEAVVAAGVVHDGADGAEADGDVITLVDDARGQVLTTNLPHRR
jgi:hypothetical protein